MARLADINRPLTSAEFDPRKHVIYSTKQVKKEYKKRGMQLVSDAEKKRLNRLVELEARAQKIKDKEERKKKNALKRKAKEEKDKEKGIVHVPKRFKVTSSQCHLDGFFGRRGKKVESEEEEEEEETESGSGREESNGEGEQGDDTSEEESAQQPQPAACEEDAEEDIPEERTILGEIDTNATPSRSKRHSPRRIQKPVPPSKRSPTLRRKPSMDSIPEELFDKDDDVPIPWEATAQENTVSLRAMRNRIESPPQPPIARRSSQAQEDTVEQQSPLRSSSRRSWRPSQAARDQVTQQSPMRPPRSSYKFSQVRRSLIAKPATPEQNVVDDVPGATQDEFSDFDIPDDVLAQCSNAQSPAAPPVEDVEPPKEATRVIPDSEDEDEFDDLEDESLLFNVSQSAFKNSDEDRKAADATPQPPAPVEELFQQEDAEMHLTQNVFSMSQLEPTPSPEKRYVDDAVPPVEEEHLDEEEHPGEEEPLAVAFQQPEQQKLPLQEDSGNDMPAEEEDFFSSSFPMTQCETIIFQAQALKTPARTFPLPPKFQAETPIPVAATAPNPKNLRHTPQSAKNEFNIGSSFFEDDGLLDGEEDHDDKTTTTPASPRPDPVANEPESSDSYGYVDDFDDERLLESLREEPLERYSEGDIEIFYGGASQGSSNYGEFTAEEASILDFLP